MSDLEKQYQKMIETLENSIKDKDELKVVLKKYIKNKKTIIICLDNRYQLTNLELILDTDNIVVTNEDEIFEGKIRDYIAIC